MWWLREGGDAVAVIITPEPGRHKAIGQLLLALADSPSQVQWTTWPTAGFAVSDELFAKFSGAQSDGEDKAEEEPEAQSPPKRRGRRKETSTDNNDSEEG